MARMKFGNTKVYIVPGCDHRFSSKKDAMFHCEQNGIDWQSVEIYDSVKEYNRWLELQTLEKNGKIANLRRQVEYEIIPAAYETVLTRVRMKKRWLVSQDGCVGKYFETRRDAVAHCKRWGYPLSSITGVTVPEPVFKERCIEKNACYTADFVYDDESGNEVVEDSKSDATRKEADYVLRRKLMLFIHKIRILET